LPEHDDDPRWTRVYLGNDDEVLACFSIGDELRKDALQAIEKLQKTGFTPIIASGDRESVVRDVATQLNIETWHAGLTPADKLQLLANLQQNGKPVVMVGDGINDAPVLAAADGSIALDSGTALARASADAVSLGRYLGTINTAIHVARKTRQIIRQNITGLSFTMLRRFRWRSVAC